MASFIRFEWIFFDWFSWNLNPNRLLNNQRILRKGTPGMCLNETLKLWGRKIFANNVTAVKDTNGGVHGDVSCSNASVYCPNRGLKTCLSDGGRETECPASHANPSNFGDDFVNNANLMDERGGLRLLPSCSISNAHRPIKLSK